MTTDSVNAETAEKLAAQCGFDLEIVEPRDLTRMEREQAPVVVDWDFVPGEQHARILSGAAGRILGVHGYNLGEDLTRFLPRRRIAYRPKLDVKLFRTVVSVAKAA
jgi:hypothetical protein